MEDRLDDFEFAIFFPLASDTQPHRMPLPGAEGLEYYREWLDNATGRERFEIRERLISGWRVVE